MMWNHRAASTSGKYREVLILYDESEESETNFGLEILHVVNNHHDHKVHIRDVTKLSFDSWNRRNEGNHPATSEDFQKFIGLIFVYGDVEVS